MYLLKPQSPYSSFKSFLLFTFHHVSIKTICNLNLIFLNINSHSTMYLLKLIVDHAFSAFKKFTFHHVSIKTCGYFRIYISKVEFTFHHVSIKTSPYVACWSERNGFTFHHVSIKTNIDMDTYDIYYYSHSTMYLLKRAYLLKIVSLHSFTFHHVSIKTLSSWFRSLLSASFTFHHVSIKTVHLLWLHLWYMHSHSTMYLLKLTIAIQSYKCRYIHIPPCIY